MNMRGKIVFLVILIILNSLILSTVYLIANNKKPDPKMLEIERKLKLCPLPTPTPVLPTPTPSPIPPEKETNVSKLIELVYDKEHFGPDSARSAAARRLGELRAAESVQPLLEIMADTSYFSCDEVRSACAFSLGMIGDVSAEPGLVEAMKNGNTSAARALAMFTTPTSREELVKHFKALANTRDVREKSMILTLLDIFAAQKVESVIETCVSLLRFFDREVVAKALSTLRAIDKITAVPLLLEYDYPESPIRDEVVPVINSLLLTSRTFTTLLRDDFSKRSDFWTFSRDHYQSITAEESYLSIFSARPGSRLEAYCSVPLEGDFDIDLQMKKIKGKNNSPFGISLGEIQDQRIEILVRYNPPEKKSFELSVYEAKGKDFQKIFTIPDFPLSSDWIHLRVRHIDSIVTIFADENYLKSLRTLKTDGSFGLVTGGENHAGFDDLVVQKISGPRVLKPVKEEKPEVPVAPSNKKAEKTVELSSAPQSPTPAPQAQLCYVDVFITAKLPDIVAVVISIDGKETTRIGAADLNVDKPPKENLFHWSGTYTAHRSFKVKPGSHEVGAYVVRKDKKTEGATCSVKAGVDQKATVKFESRRSGDSIRCD